MSTQQKSLWLISGALIYIHAEKERKTHMNGGRTIRDKLILTVYPLRVLFCDLRLPAQLGVDLSIAHMHNTANHRVLILILCPLLVQFSSIQKMVSIYAGKSP